jgi:hypothetical protein
VEVRKMPKKYSELNFNDVREHLDRVVRDQTGAERLDDRVVAQTLLLLMEEAATGRVQRG